MLNYSKNYNFTSDSWEGNWTFVGKANKGDPYSLTLTNESDTGYGVILAIDAWHLNDTRQEHVFFQYQELLFCSL